MSSSILPLLTGRIFFRCFRMSFSVCIVWSCLGFFLVFLLLLVPSYLSGRVVSFVLIALLFSLRSSIFWDFSSALEFCLLSKIYLCFQSNFPSRFWLSGSSFSEDPEFFHRLISLRWDRLTRDDMRSFNSWCSLGYKLRRLFFHLPWIYSSLGSWEKVMGLSLQT